MIRTRFFVTSVLALVLAFLFVAPMAFVGVSASGGGSSHCSPAGSTGLTTYMTAKSGEVISGKLINAAGCDVGVYVPPGSHGVVIQGNLIKLAGIHGIFVQDSWNIVVSGNKVVNNSGNVPAVSCDFIAPPCINEGKAIQFVGTSNSVISNNLLKNDQFGGIAVTDDGFIDPGALNSGNPHPADNNVITGNRIVNVSNDCGIVLASYNAIKSHDNQITNNEVFGSLPPFGVNPYVGQIVVATDAPNATMVDTVVANNVIYKSTLPGIVVHSNAPGDRIARTLLEGNKLADNGYYPPFFSSPNTPVEQNGTTGISIVAEAYPGMTAPPEITHTTLVNNKISSDQNGVWLCMTRGTTITNTPTPSSTVTHPVVICGNGGS